MAKRIVWTIVLVITGLIGMNGVGISEFAETALLTFVLVAVPLLVMYAYCVCRFDKIGELAVKKKWLTCHDVASILNFQKEQPEKFGEIAVKQQYLSSKEVEVLLTEQSN